MLGEERRSRLLEIVRTHQFASLPQLKVELPGVSESTIRRDLEVLEELRAVRRIHGGALFAGSGANVPQFETREAAQWDLKRAIAQRAAALIDDGDTVLLDGGSTTYEVARLLVGRPLHVVTTSLPVANLLASDPTSDLVLIGGIVCSADRRGPRPLCRPEGMLSHVRVRKDGAQHGRGSARKASSTTICC